MNVMVQCPMNNKCVFQFLGFREVNLATAINIFMVITDILNVRQFKWSQVITVMVDNCSVMSRVRSGVEALVKKVYPFFKNVNGDTVHKINNAASTFLTPIESSLKVQKFLSGLFYDIEDSPKQKGTFLDVFKRQFLENV